MSIRLYPILRSLGSLLLPTCIVKRPGTGGTGNSEYCYSVWLRHLKHLFSKNLIKNLSEIEKIAEIGPGDSLGIGISALYTGVKKYFAFDIIKHTDINKNLIINDELFNLFKNQAEIPHGKGFEKTFPKLDNYSFPQELKCFSSNYYKIKNAAIKDALLNKESELQIKYVAPWYYEVQQEIKNVDLIFSQAVMEHVDDIEYSYGEMFKWLKKGGIISHQIDFKTHKITKEWNGHWFISERMWKFLMVGRKFPINRLPLSVHLNIMEKIGFEIINVVHVKNENGMVNKKTKLRNYNFTNDDLITSGALIQAIKQ